MDFTIKFRAPAAHLARVPLVEIAEQIQRGDEPGVRPTAADLIEEFGGPVTVTIERDGESVSWESA